MEYIIKYYATKMLFRPIYVSAYDRDNLDKKIAALQKVDAQKISVVQYLNRDKRIEGALKRCSIGSERENVNLQILYNDNLENEIDF